ncbi:DUF739 family protein [Macrococcus armenti]|uniref:DUF739 family protein n=1 Tax=Macrococcus armenti TaxID=2875764 RepID=UPI001CD418F3|nr:DUF739 family protein [Macrococcus armenti]UBH10117.1 DUF739 family protein [Macrococcus armenti]
MCFDYSLLDGKITEKFKSRSKFADALGLSERSLSLKMNNKRAWTQRDINKAVELLGVEPDEISDYFFKLEVQ